MAKFWAEWKKRGQRWRRETISRPSSPSRPQPSWAWTTTPPTKPSLLSEDRPPILVRWTILKMALPTSKLTKKSGKSLDNLASSQHSIVSNSIPLVRIVVMERRIRISVIVFLCQSSRPSVVALSRSTFRFPTKGPCLTGCSAEHWLNTANTQTLAHLPAPEHRPSVTHIPTKPLLTNSSPLSPPSLTEHDIAPSPWLR